VRFFERAHIKDVLCYVRLLINLADTAAWLRVLMHEEGVGPAAAQKIAEAMKNITTVSEVLEAGRKAVSGKALQGFEQFGRIWQEIITATDPHQVVEAVARSTYKEYLEAEYIDFSDRVQDIEQLAVFAERYEKTEDFLAEATLQESFVLSQGLKSEVRELKSQIVLSTIHQAKGLEWEHVFIVHAAEGLFPSEKAYDDEYGIEEERRLFYVAVTRAKTHLTITYPLSGGYDAFVLRAPSQFLQEISRQLFTQRSLPAFGASRPLTVFNKKSVEDGDGDFYEEQSIDLT
jgi:DNA helicase-2/ATP-dependent DNA helicase PcrA